MTNVAIALLAYYLNVQITLATTALLALSSSLLYRIFFFVSAGRVVPFLRRRPTPEHQL